MNAGVSYLALRLQSDTEQECGPARPPKHQNSQGVSDLVRILSAETCGTQGEHSLISEAKLVCKLRSQLDPESGMVRPIRPSSLLIQSI